MSLTLRYLVQVTFKAIIVWYSQRSKLIGLSAQSSGNFGQKLEDTPNVTALYDNYNKIIKKKNFAGATDAYVDG
jgi:hypothetical protein